MFGLGQYVRATWFVEAYNAVARILHRIACYQLTSDMASKGGRGGQTRANRPKQHGELAKVPPIVLMSRARRPSFSYSCRERRCRVRTWIVITVDAVS